MLSILAALLLVVRRELGPLGPRAGKGPTYAPTLAAPGKYFSWREVTRTSTGLPNQPSPQAARNLVLLVSTLDQVREDTRLPMRVHSAFRSPGVNAAVGGVSDSRHLEGLAADVSVVGLSAEDLAVRFRESPAPFDKLIWYPTLGHVHVQVSPTEADRDTLVRAPTGYRRQTPVRA